MPSLLQIGHLPSAFSSSIIHLDFKPYSSFIYSSVNADADFEREWNSFYMQSKARGLNCLSYRELNNALDQIKETIINTTKIAKSCIAVNFSLSK